MYSINVNYHLVLCPESRAPSRGYVCKAGGCLGGHVHTLRHW
jgi:hypothetical protein